MIAIRPNPGRNKLLGGVFDFVDVQDADPADQDDRYRAPVPECESRLFDELKGLADRVREAVIGEPDSGWATLADALAALGAFRGRSGFGDSRRAR